MAKTEKAAKRAARRPAPAIETTLARADAWHAASAAFALFVLYAATACRTIHTGDSPELATAAALFGIPHPPGYPLYTLVTALLVHAAPFANKAFEANLASSLYGALAAGGAWLLFRRLGASRAGAWAGALVLGLGRTYWLESARAEVYSFDMLLFVAALHAALSAGRAPARGRLVLAGLLAGFWIGHRFVNLAYAIPLLVLARPALLRMPGRRAALLVAGGFAASWLVYLYLPIASRANPALDVGDPQTWDRFWVVVSATQYARHLLSNTASLAAMRLGHYATNLVIETGIGVFIAALGAAALWRPRRRFAAGWLILIAMNLLIASRYNIIDIEDYFLPSYLAIAALAAAGATWTIARVREAAGARWAPAAAGALVALSLAGLPLNRGHSDLSSNDIARRLAEDILASASPRGVLFAHGDTTIHALWYLQYVENREPDVLVVSLGHARTWYYEQLRRRYPNDPIPANLGDIPEQMQSQRITEALQESRPVYFTLTTDVSKLTGEGAAFLQRHDFVPHGMLYEMRPKARRVDPDEWTRWTVAFWRGVAPRIARIDAGFDSETLSVGAEYALGLMKSGELLLRLGHRDEARPLFAAIVTLDPDPLEAALLEQYERIGWSPPKLSLGKRAQAFLAGPAAGG